MFFMAKIRTSPDDFYFSFSHLSKNFCTPHSIYPGNAASNNSGIRFKLVAILPIEQGTY